MPPSGTRIVNVYTDQYEVYIGRAYMAPPGQDGTFGNPHNIGRCRTCSKNGHEVTHTRHAALEAFKDYFMERVQTDAVFRKKVEGLRGKVLGCFCRPGTGCHGHVIIAYLEMGEEAVANG